MKKEILVNSSIPVLRAIQSLQNNMIDIINDRESINKDIRDMAEKIQVKNNFITYIINKKKAIEDKESFAIFEGKISVEDIKRINNLENNKIIKKPVSSIENWRKNVYSPGIKYEKIPYWNRNSSIIPLPLKRGFLVGGNYPDNPIPYRYVTSDGKLKSYLPEIVNNFRSNNDFVDINFNTQNLVQEPTIGRITLVNEFKTY